MFADGHDSTLPSAKHPTIVNSTEGHPYVVYRDDWVTATGKLIPIRLAYLFEGKIITEPKLFYCAGNLDRPYRYDSYIDPPPWGTLPQEYNYPPSATHPRGGRLTDSNQWIRIGYTYYPTDPKTELINDREVSGEWYPKEETTRFDRLNPNIPYLTDVIHNRETLSHKSGAKKVVSASGITRVILQNPGMNALFKDGHVIYANDRTLFTLGVWDPWESKAMGTNYPPFYYTIFKNIQP
jgi:hypothetical protein